MPYSESEDTVRSQGDQDSPSFDGSSMIKKKRAKKSTYKIKKDVWTPEEDKQLIHCMEIHGDKSWRYISKIMMKSMIKCHKRFLELSNQTDVLKTRWTEEEDAILKEYVLANGAKNWSKIASKLPGRIAKQCRERWHNKLNPGIVVKAWTVEEDNLILKLIYEKGTRWSEISREMEGRTSNAIKNHYNQNLKKRVSPGCFLEVPKVENKTIEEAVQPTVPQSVTKTPVKE